MGNDFSWSDVEDDIVVESVGAIAVYENPKGDIVIRQQANGYADEDAVVVVPRRFVPDLVRKILKTSELEVGTLRVVKDESDDV